MALNIFSQSKIGLVSVELFNLYKPQQVFSRYFRLWCSSIPSRKICNPSYLCRGYHVAFFGLRTIYLKLRAIWSSFQFLKILADLTWSSWNFSWTTARLPVLLALVLCIFSIILALFTVLFFLTCFPNLFVLCSIIFLPQKYNMKCQRQGFHFFFSS